jgi:ParB family chromosome partitioning protein
MAEEPDPLQSIKQRRAQLQLHLNQLSELPERGPEPTAESEGLPKPKTGVGVSLQRYALQQIDRARECERLRERVVVLEGLLEQATALQQQVAAWTDVEPLHRLDPRLVRASRWAVRDPRHYGTRVFGRFRDEIRDVGGNLSPIKVRPLQEPDAEGRRFELVCGYRRHRACLDLGLPVLAMVEVLDDKALVIQMLQDSLSQAPLSPWERGQVFSKLIEDGIFTTPRSIADALRVPLHQVEACMKVAALPDWVVGAFASPLEIKCSFLPQLERALQKSPREVRSNAQSLAAMQTKPPGNEVVRWLGDGGQREEFRPLLIEVRGRRIGSVLRFGDSGTVISLEVGAMSSDRLMEVMKGVQALLKPADLSRS